MIDVGPPADTLLLTKTLVPVAPAKVVTRDRLFQVLDQGLNGKVTSVVAPAGFGKTVLVAGWVAQLDEQLVAWVSLDRGDDDPSRFWMYVRASLASAGITMFRSDAPSHTGDPTSTEIVRQSVIDALAHTEQPVVLVLDDYHHVEQAQIHQDVTFLLEQHLPRFQLVLLSRFDPPLGLARWRAQGQATQIRVAQLAFDRPEMRSFLREQEVELTDELHEILYVRVGGWAAALRLVTLWVSGESHPAGAIAAFASTDDAIADYLTTEVLEHLPTELRLFLLRTSVLSRLTGPLCDAVMGSSGHETTLRNLFQRGLFVEASDPDWTWFRYHQLFADLLRQQLRRSYPELIDQLHRRASQWFFDNGFASEAIEHSLAAHDWATVERLMLREALSIGARYQPSVVEQWLSLIPGEWLRTSAYLQLMQAFVLANTGRVESAEQSLATAEKLTASTVDRPELVEQRALLHVIRGGIARLNCDLPGARRCLQAVEAALEEAGNPKGDVAELFRAAAKNSVAGALLWSGDINGADTLLDQILHQTDPRFVRMRVNAMSARAFVLATYGRLREASALATQSLELGRTVGISGLFQTNPAHLAVGLVALQRHDIEQARDRLQLALDNADSNADHGPRMIAGMLVAALTAHRDGLPAGFDVLEQTRRIWPGWRAPAALEAAIDAEEARLHLMGGDLVAAQRVLAHLDALPASSPLVAVQRQVTAARLLQAQRAPTAAAAFELAAELALSAQNMPLAVGSLIGRAVSGPSDDRALRYLDQALVLAQEEQIVAPFLAGTAVRPLLLRMATTPGVLSRSAFRRQLLDLMGPPAAQVAPTAVRSLRPHELTDRETSVLRLLRNTSLSNAEIAAALHISANTMKSHVRHLYSKLGVTTRQEALLRSGSSV